MKIKISGWEEGMRKIQFPRYLKEEFSITLSKAKDIKDRLVDYNEPIEFEVRDKEHAKEVQNRLIDLGVKSQVLD